VLSSDRGEDLVGDPAQVVRSTCPRDGNAGRANKCEPLRVALSLAFCRFKEIRARVTALFACFNGKPELLKDAVCAMYELRYQATALMKTPPDRSVTDTSMTNVMEESCGHALPM
jgi:hypothetical protein